MTTSNSSVSLIYIVKQRTNEQFRYKHNKNSPLAHKKSRLNVWTNSVRDAFVMKSYAFMKDI